MCPRLKGVEDGYGEFQSHKTIEEILPSPFRFIAEEVIEFLRCASSSFFTAERYEWLRKKVIKDGSRRKYKKSDVLAFVERLQKSA
jgi:hypothetical protein